MHPRSRKNASPLALKVYQGLLDDMSTRRRGAGDRLVEAEIAREMDVSRTPVREALRRLATDGLITEAKPGGYAIITPSIEDIREIFEIRKALEPLAFANVVRDADGSGDDELRAALADLQQADTMPAAVRANIAFRGFWMERITNRRLRETLKRFEMQVNIVRAATLYSQAARDTARDGAARLAAAYLARDTAAAQRAMAEFIADAFTFFQRADEEQRLHPVSPSRAEDAGRTAQK